MVDRVLRWAGPVAIAVLMCRVVQIAAQPVRNGDTWFHLRLGRELGRPWEWSSVEHWSSFATSPWVPTQPLPQQLMAGVEDLFGLPGIAWLYGLAMIGFLLSVYVVCRRHAEPLVAAVVTGCALVGCAGTMSPRPQVISLVLLVLVVDVWLRTEEDLRPRWWLVPVTWLWSVCHGFWVIGVAVGVAVVVGLVLQGRARGRTAARLAALPVACGLAAALTPMGPRLVLAPLTVNERAELITEWQRTAFTGPGPWLVVALLTAAVIIPVARRRSSVPRLAVLAMAAVWLVLSVRTVAVAAVLVAPLAAAALQSLVSPVRTGTSRRDVHVLWGIGAMLLVGLAFVVPRTAAEPGAVPDRLDPQLSELPSGTTILNDSAIGGWLAWRHPHLEVVVDGMFDAYPVDHLRAVQRLVSAEEGWEEFIEGTGADVALLEQGTPVVDELLERGWSDRGEDEGYVLLESPQRRR